MAPTLASPKVLAPPRRPYRHRPYLYSYGRYSYGPNPRLPGGTGQKNKVRMLKQRRSAPTNTKAPTAVEKQHRHMAAGERP